MVFEPPCTERYARWCERSTAQIMISLLLDAYKELISLFGLLCSDTASEKTESYHIHF